MDDLETDEGLARARDSGEEDEVIPALRARPGVDVQDLRDRLRDPEAVGAANERER